MSNLHITAMSKLIGAKIDPNVDKEILQIYVAGEMFKILTLCRTENGYELKEVREIPKNYDPKILLGSSNPSKIILSNAIPFFPSAKIVLLKSYLSTWNPITLEGHVRDYLFDAVKEIVDHMFRTESGKKYFVIPQCLDQFGISAVECNPSKNDILVSTDKHECLPLTKSCIITRFDNNKYYLAVKDKTNFNILQQPHEITKEGHRIKLTLSVDINNMPTLNHEGVLLSRVKNMPKKLKIEKTEMLPIIGFFDYASVICLWDNENNRYDFLDSWNGKFGKDLFLDFMFPKSTLADSFKDITCLSAAVYDLITIMSMPADDIKVDPKWKFTITKDEDNPVLLEFDTFEEKRMPASPTYLMARIFNEHIRAIKKETGIKPKKLGFRLLDEFESADARKRVEAGLKEACEYIKVECLIV
uniref:Uncharacterized protein n=1 Tax=Panagrolaimus sp. ES5 TaxID=591445 RepID=A0AC34GWU1_9BILA